MKKLVLLLLCCVGQFYAPAFAQTNDDENTIWNEFIVMLKPGHDVKNLLASHPELKVKECLSPRMNIYLLERNVTAAAEEFLLTLCKNEQVKLAQFNHRIEQRAFIPNDIQFYQQWNMLNTGQSGGIAGADIDATEAWAINNDNITTNGDTVVVAIIDAKVDLNHPDLDFFTNYNEIPGNSIDDDGNGYIDDVNGWNAAQNNGLTSGIDNHTMHTAGIAAAKGHNNMGVAGVCWGAKILPVVYGSAMESNVVQAYDYVRNMRLLFNNTFGTQGAFIVSTNSSFGVNMAFPAAYPIWCAMYDSMGAVGILSAAATSNSFWDVDVQGDIPTTCLSNWLIGVTNTTNTDSKNGAWGKQSIDLGAPGTNVLSTFSGSSYNFLTGTSMASPHVAGAIAAMYAAACKAFIDEYLQHPDSVALLVKEYLLDGAEWVSSMNNVTATNGRLNLYRAITNLKRFDCDSCNFNVAITKTPVSCKNSNDGTLNLSTSPGNITSYSILWSDSQNLASRMNLSPGFYSVTVADSTGCSRTATVELHNPDTIKINAINVIGATDSTSGNIAINASAGNEPLEYSLDGNNYQSTSVFTVPVNGTYTVYVRNTSGCVVQQNVVVSGIDDAVSNNWQLSAYPNPANDALTVYSLQFEQGKHPLQVFDGTGRKVVEITPSTVNCQLSTVDLANGVYFLRYRNITKKFVVLH